MEHSSRLSFWGTHFISFILGIVVCTLITFSILPANTATSSQAGLSYEQGSRTKAHSSHTFNASNKTHVDLQQTVQAAHSNHQMQKNTPAKSQESENTDEPQPINTASASPMSTAISMDEVRAKARQQAQQVLKKSIINIEPEKASMMDRGINENTNLDDRALTYQRLLQDFLDANLTEPHYLQELRCNEKLCRIAAISSEPNELQSVLLSMTNESWYNSLMFKSPNTSATDYHVYYLPFVANG